MKINYKILENPNIKSYAKSLYLYLAYVMQYHNLTHLLAPDEVLSNSLGISKHQLYRARSLLQHLQVLKHNKSICPQRGILLAHEYKLI